jgi:hypothetical protein
MAPDTVTTVELPEQIVGLLTVTVGELLTVTNTVVVPEHTPVAPVIVYVVLTVGVAVTVVPFDELKLADGLHV